jgi:hypothetical protein
MQYPPDCLCRSAGSLHLPISRAGLTRRPHGSLHSALFFIATLHGHASRIPFRSTIDDGERSLSGIFPASTLTFTFTATTASASLAAASAQWWQSRPTPTAAVQITHSEVAGGSSYVQSQQRQHLRRGINFQPSMLTTAVFVGQHHHLQTPSTATGIDFSNRSTDRSRSPSASAFVATSTQRQRVFRQLATSPQRRQCSANCGHRHRFQ